VGAAILTSGFLGRWGSRAPLLLASICAAASILIMSVLLGVQVVARSGTELAIAALASGLAGGSTGLGIATIYGLLSYSYPVAYRSTGMGIGMMFGRSGGICIALAGGALLTLDGANTRPFFIVLGALALASIAGAALIDRHVPAGLARRERAATS
jgi:AAHS family 4-hydroxybenzoate transporter-like MFS transporter